MPLQGCGERSQPSRRWARSTERRTGPAGRTGCVEPSRERVMLDRDAAPTRTHTHPHALTHPPTRNAPHTPMLTHTHPHALTQPQSPTCIHIHTLIMPSHTKCHRLRPCHTPPHTHSQAHIQSHTFTRTRTHASPARPLVAARAARTDPPTPEFRPRHWDSKSARTTNVPSRGETCQ